MGAVTVGLAWTSTYHAAMLPHPLASRIHQHVLSAVCAGDMESALVSLPDPEWVVFTQPLLELARRQRQAAATASGSAVAILKQLDDVLAEEVCI